MRPYLAAGVAIVGASLIAVNPVAPTMAADIQERAVQLTGAVASDIGDVATNVGTAAVGSLDVNALSSLAAAASTATNPITEWADVLNTALSNTQTLANDWLADPFPVLAQVIHNQVGFASTFGASLQSMANGLITFGTQKLPGLFQDLVNGIAAGNIGASVTTFNSELLFGLLPVATGLINILDIPGEMATNLANVLTDNLPSIGLTALLAPITLWAGGSEAVADGLQSALDAWDAGQPTQALIDAVNIPAMLTGALLNGYSPVNPGVGTTGLLGTPGGILDTFLISLPQQIAQTLAGGSGATTATLAGDLSELGAMITDSLSAALNPGAFTAALNPGAFATAFDPAALSMAFDPAALSMAFDPAAVTDIGSMLAADLAPNLGGMVMDLLSLF